MPELPDVETFKEYFQATALHQEIDGVEVKSTDVLEGVSKQRLIEKLSNRKFCGVTRHGKYLFAELTGEGWLVLHFGMTGSLKYFQNDQHAPDHIRILISFTNDYSLAYDCPRKLGRVSWTDDRKQFVADKELGPDPLHNNFNKQVFSRILETRRGMIKSLLMNQKALAGIGNIYSDEILFQAGIHPETGVHELRKDEVGRLYDCLMHVLHTAIDLHVGKKGWPDDWLLPHRKAGTECPRCGDKIIKLQVCGRSAYCCGKHQ